MKYLSLLTWVGQFGFSCLFPTCVFLMLGYYLQNRFDLGVWIMILMGVIDLRIPGSYIVTFAALTLVFGGFDINYTTAQLCAGGLMFGAFFMATDYVTSPITPMGQILFGISCGIFTWIFRTFGANAEGVSFAIILSNILVPLIEKITIPTAFGVVKAKPAKGDK